MSGIAKLFQRKLHDRYVAGLWANDFLEGMLWERDRFAMSPSSVIMPTSYCAPSWSWASGLSPVSYYQSKMVSTFTVLVNVECTLAGTDLTGRVRAGGATLYGPLIEAWVWTLQNDVDSSQKVYLHLNRDSPAICDFTIDCPLAIEEVVDSDRQVQWKIRRIESFEIESSKCNIDFGFGENTSVEIRWARVYCLHIGIRYVDPPRSFRESWALVLSRSEADPESFVRLGISNGTTRDHKDFFRGAKNKTIKII
ncbi:MAG: hypothetical protein Q9160_006351 [Pyrenula sp. 1 TL-2023]